MTARDRIRVFVHDLVAAKGISAELADEDPLVTSGRLDSMDVLQIVMFLEENYAADFSVVDFDPELFDSIAGIYSMIAARAE